MKIIGIALLFVIGIAIGGLSALPLSACFAAAFSIWAAIIGSVIGAFLTIVVFAQLPSEVHWGEVAVALGYFAGISLTPLTLRLMDARPTEPPVLLGLIAFVLGFVVMVCLFSSLKSKPAQFEA